MAPDRVGIEGLLAMEREAAVVETFLRREVDGTGRLTLPELHMIRCLRRVRITRSNSAGRTSMCPIVSDS